MTCSRSLSEGTDLNLPFLWLRALLLTHTVLLRDPLPVPGASPAVSMSGVLGSALLGLGPGMVKHTASGLCMSSGRSPSLTQPFPLWCVMPPGHQKLGRSGRPVSPGGRSMAHSGEEEHYIYSSGGAIPPTPCSRVPPRLTAMFPSWHLGTDFALPVGNPQGEVCADPWTCPRGRETSRPDILS